MTQQDSEQQPDGSANVFLHPPDLLQFVSTEHQKFLTSLVICHEEIEILAHVHGLYMAAMTNQTTDVSTVVIFQLLTFVHYHFLFASSSYMRCHMAEGFSSARAAIDGALIASQIILPIRLAQGGWQVLDMFAWSEYPAPVLGWR